MAMEDGEIWRRILQAANATAANSSAALSATCDKTCYMKATSDGVFANEYPINYSLMLLIIQLCLVLFFSRIFAVILRPMRQPRVIAEILGGIVLGVSVMGQIPGFTAAIFPPRSITVLTTVANLGLCYFLFMVGLELDLRSLSKVGSRAMLISAAGIIFPFVLGIGAAFAVRATLGITSAFGPFCVFMGVAMSITAFPVLARILAERRLLTTDVGSMAMSCAAVDDVVAWILLALAVALTTPNASPAIVAWILLCGVAFVVLMFVVVRPLMAYAVRGVISNGPVPEWIVAVTLVGVLVSSFTTDVIGIHAIFGAFVFGLCIPKDGPFATIILEKIEDFVSIIMLPLYFASAGLAVRFESIQPSSVGLVFLIIGCACAGKILGITGASLLSGFPFKKSIVLGILMNTKGLVELIVLNIGLQKKVINQELYTIMVIMALVTTFMTTPIVMLIYAPARERRVYTKTLEGAKDNELRLLECIYGSHNIPGMLNLTEVFRGTRKHPLRVFLMHLMEFSERSSAISMITRVRKDGRPYSSKEAAKKDQVVVAFQAYADLSRVNVVPMTSISKFDNMHEDICATIEDKGTSLVVLPYYKATNSMGEEVVNYNYQQVTRKLLRIAPCSVAILVDRGLGGFSHVSPANVERHIAVLFFGGPDDREALTLARRMVEHPGVYLTLIHYKPSNEAAISMEIEQQSQGSKVQGAALAAGSFAVSLDRKVLESEARLDEEALIPIMSLIKSQSVSPASEQHEDASAEDAEDAHDAHEIKAEAVDKSLDRDDSMAVSRPRRKRPAKKVQYELREVDDVSAALLALAQEDYDLVVLGRGRRPPALLAGLAAQQTPFRAYYRPSILNTEAAAENSGSDLGPVGDVLATSETRASLLVVQQHDETMVRPVSEV